MSAVYKGITPNGLEDVLYGQDSSVLNKARAWCIANSVRTMADLKELPDEIDAFAAAAGLMGLQKKLIRKRILELEVIRPLTKDFGPRLRSFSMIATRRDSQSKATSLRWPRSVRRARGRMTRPSKKQRHNPRSSCRPRRSR